MAIDRTAIEKALDEIISNEEGMRFQGLAVVLAKQKWPELIASERKKDLGLDAHAPELLASDGKGKGLASSLTATLENINKNIQRFQSQNYDVKIVIFVTPQKVTNYSKKNLAEEVRQAYGIELITISREDIITDLLQPPNASICRTFLKIPVPVEIEVTELLEKTQDAASHVIDCWLKHPRLAGRPKIDLYSVRLDKDGSETEEILDLEILYSALLESSRIVIEAPAGRGKTTTLIQLADRHRKCGELAFLIDLPALVESSLDILEFIAREPSFQSRHIQASRLARIYEAVHCSFLLNGWNEVSEINSSKAVRALANLERSFPQAGIIVTTRTHHIQPSLPGSFGAKLLPLNREQRTEYLKRTLTSRADELAAQLDDDRVLDDLTRTPLILAEVVTIFQSGRPIPKTKVGVLGAVMQLIEQTDEHRHHLQRSPLLGHSIDYLTELSVKMMTKGETTIEEAGARKIVHSVSQKLRAQEQIAAVPEPLEILSALCAHHVLERLEYPSVRFRFEHQQFQEFYGSVEIKRLLSNIVENDDAVLSRNFAEEYLNKPVWEVPLRMIAEEIGDTSSEKSASENMVAAGRRLVTLALDIDPIFAADLGRICGTLVWTEVRSSIAERLRTWYSVGDDYHRRCALAGMIASGSDDFIDILRPLLTCDDQQVRLGTYGARREFHVSSFGKNWRDIINTWNEEQRAEFVSEVLRESWMVCIAEEFASTDPSEKVRVAALAALEWVDAAEAVSRVLSGYDDELLEKILREGVLFRGIPSSLRPRALTIYKKILQETDDLVQYLRTLLRIAEIDKTNILRKTKDVLTKWPIGRIDDTSRYLIRPALELLQKSDSRWVSRWVAERIVEGTLWSDEWIGFVSSISKTFKQALLNRISGSKLEHTKSRDIVSVLAATADVSLATRVFLQLCKLQSKVVGERESSEDNSEIMRQLQRLLQEMEPNIAISGMVNGLSFDVNHTQYHVVIEHLQSLSFEDGDFRSEVSDELRQALRQYLKQRAPLIQSQAEATGWLKVKLAKALALVGDPEDITELRQLILADAERLKRAREIRERNQAGVGAVVSYSNSYVQAILLLDSEEGEELLLEVLNVLDYEEAAATALIQLAKVSESEKRFQFNKLDYHEVWEARSRLRQSGFDEDRRQRYSFAIKERISLLKEERSQSSKPDSFNHRLKSLAHAVAVLDGRKSAELVIEIMTLPGEWDGWTRVKAMEALLLWGANLRAEAALDVLNPTIDFMQARINWDQQAKTLLPHCLDLLPFVNPPSQGIAKIREVLSTAKLPGWELRQVVTALGHSRSNEAHDLLVELATTEDVRMSHIAREWIDAVADLDTPQSKQILVNFVDPNVKQLEIEKCFKDDDRKQLASRIADVARTESEIKDRLYRICASDIPPSIRQTLSRVFALLGTADDLIVGLNLVDDDGDPQIPYKLVEALKSLFLEQRPYGDTGYSYTLEPRGAHEIRKHLFDMALTDSKRRRSAWALIGQTELWRIEYGRPDSEPRHPASKSGKRWPPIDEFI